MSLSIATNTLVLITAGLAVLSGFLSWRLHAQADRAYERMGDAEDSFSEGKTTATQNIDRGQRRLREAANALALDPITKFTTWTVFLVFILAAGLAILTLLVGLQWEVRVGLPHLGFWSTVFSLVFIFCLTVVSLADTGSIVHRLRRLSEHPMIDFERKVALGTSDDPPSTILSTARHIYLQLRRLSDQTPTSAHETEKRTEGTEFPSHHGTPYCNCLHYQDIAHAAEVASREMPTWLAPHLIAFVAWADMDMCGGLHYPGGDNRLWSRSTVKAQKSTYGIAALAREALHHQCTTEQISPTLQTLFVGYKYASGPKLFELLEWPSHANTKGQVADEYVSLVTDVSRPETLNTQAMSLVPLICIDIHPTTPRLVFEERAEDFSSILEDLVLFQHADPGRPGLAAMTAMGLVLGLMNGLGEQVGPLQRLHRENTLRAVGFEAPDPSELLQYGRARTYLRTRMGVMTEDYTEDLLNLGCRQIGSSLSRQLNSGEDDRFYTRRLFSEYPQIAVWGRRDCSAIAAAAMLDLDVALARRDGGCGSGPSEEETSALMSTVKDSVREMLDTVGRDEFFSHKRMIGAGTDSGSTWTGLVEPQHA